MKILTLILITITHHFSFSQTDTIRVDVEEMSINFKTCECILFGNCRSYSFPVKADWKRADSLFIGNRDTIYFILKDHGVTKIEGYKLPEAEVSGKIKFYNKNSELVKIEFWEPVYLIKGNDGASWSDGYYWAKQMVYRKNQLYKETTRSIIYNDEKGFAQKTESISINGVKKRTKIKIKYF